MEKANGFSKITVEELHDWLEGGGNPVLINTLPGDQHAKARLPGSRNACVFEVVFPGQVAAIVADRDREIVVYGASGASHDALTAAEKLARLGYAKVFALTGGVAAWREAGYPLEGEDIGAVGRSHEALDLAERTYIVDTGQSVIEWIGRNANNKHFGTIRLFRGEIAVRGGEITGSFEIDMKSVRNINLEGDELQPVLIAHLESDDFFFVEKFPRAVFTIESARQVQKPTLTAPNFEVEGTLELRGVRGKLNFPTTVSRLDEGEIAAEAHFDIDRTQWNIIYGSSRFFQHLGMHVVFDLISIQLRIVAR